MPATLQFNFDNISVRWLELLNVQPGFEWYLSCLPSLSHHLHQTIRQWVYKLYYIDNTDYTDNADYTDNTDYILWYLSSLFSLTLSNFWLQWL